MGKIENLTKDISNLSEDELNEFAEWYSAFELNTREGRCSQCKSLIPHDANICRECGFNISKPIFHFISNSNILVSLLLSVTVFLGFFVPTIIDTLGIRNSDIRAQWINADRNEIELIVWNTGSRPGFYKNAIISIGDKKKSSQRGTLGNKGNILSIDPNKYESLKLQYPSNIMSLIQNKKNLECSISINVKNFRSKLHDDLESIPAWNGNCNAISEWLNK